jgi:hypothetical protein
VTSGINGDAAATNGPRRCVYIRRPMNLKGLVAVTAAATALALLGAPRAPAGWTSVATPDAGRACQAQVLRGWAWPGDDRDSGNRLAIRCAAATESNLALTQSIAAAPYRGQRVQLSARVRVQDMRGRVGLLLQSKSADGRVLALDDMRLRPIEGSRDWAEARVLLDVGDAAESIQLGVTAESGPGTAWIEALRFETAQPDDLALAVVVRPLPSVLPAQPQNLSLR